MEWYRSRNPANLRFVISRHCKFVRLKENKAALTLD